MAYTDIDDPSAYFQVKAYAGTGSSNAVTYDGNSDMQPDLLWFKNRQQALNWMMWDSVRGITKYFYSNLTEAEGTTSTVLTAIGSDGFTVGANNNVNQSSNNIINYGWKAGTSFTNDASGTGIGSIDSTGSVNTDAGFSIISWTVPASGSATVAHGLGKVPKMIISKSRSNATDWEVYHHKTGNANTNQLNTTAAANDNNAYNDTDPTSSVFSVTASGFGANRTMVSYCFADVKGYSKFGSYTGNGNADGTFVYTGFKPAFIMIKRTDTADNWKMIDNRRIGYNGGTYFLDANRSVAEEDTVPAYFDILSNGFKARNSWTPINASGGTYIYMAFAENPFVASNFNAATAR